MAELIAEVPAVASRDATRVSWWPMAVRRVLARLFPQRPWLWDSPERFVVARLALLLLDRFWPAGSDRDVMLPFAARGRLVCGLRDIKDRVILMHGFSEYEVARLVEKLVQEDWICVDIGANSGEYTVLFALCAPRGHVYAFEPASHVYPRLRANLEMNQLPQVTAENMAVGALDGTCPFFLDRSKENTGLSSLSREAWRGQGALEETQVPCVRLDTYFSQADRLDLIKVDVEGHEMDVFRGAQGVLSRLSPIIIFEFGTVGDLPDPGTVDYLHSLGYDLYCISYDVERGPGLVPCPALNEELLLRFYSPRGPLNLVAVPAARCELLLQLVS